MKRFFFYLFLLISADTLGQNQIDLRGLFSLNVEKKITKRVSLTGIAASFLTNDFHEIGFAFFDAGLKYKITKNIGVNFNYRFMLKRNFENFYDNRPMLYGDVDFSKSFKRWTLGGTARFQGFFYSHIFDGYKSPVFYNRDKINIKYRINYYWQPFAELEFFLPLNHPVRKTIDQIRGSVGFCYTINDFVKVEVFERIQQQINRAPQNTYFLTAVNWSFRF